MSIKGKTIAGLKWNTLATVITMLIGILQVAILTRLLDKSDFGLIAIASMVIAFTDIFAELGITVALIHKQEITMKEYSSVYWLNISMSVVICAITVLLAPVIASFYKQPALTVIIRWLSLKIVFSAFGKMFQTIKTKNLEFDFISKVRILTSIVGIITSTAFASFGYGVMSLVYGQLVQILINQGIYAIAGMRQMRLQLHFSLSEVKDVLKIGGFQIGTQVLDFVASRVDVFLIGRFFTMEQLGVYNIAKELIVKPYTIINSITSNVFSAAFAKIQNNINALISYFSKLNRMVSILSIPLYAFIFIFSDLIVSVLYAPSFAEVAVFLRIMALMGLCSSITIQGGPVMVAMGRIDLGFFWTIVRIAMASVTLLLTASISIYAVAYGQSALALLSVFVYFLIVIKPILYNYSLTQYLSTFSGIFMGTLVLSLPFAVINMVFQVPVWGQCIMMVSYGILFIIYIHKFYKHELEEVLILTHLKKAWKAENSNEVNNQ